MFHRPPKKYSEYLVNVEQSIDWILKTLWKLKKGEFAQNLQEVTDEGNTTTNTIDTAGTKSDYFQLDTAATPTLLPGMFGWNDSDGTANLRLKGNNVTLQVGQETVARVVNKTGADLLESQYKVVRVRIASEGGAQGQRLAVVLAQGNNDPDSVTTLGIVTENIANNQEGFITVFGNVNEINTTGSLQGETWADGDVLFLSPTTPGSLTKVKPIAPNHSVVMGYVIYAHANHGKIFVKVDNGYELDELHNVKITSVANSDLLQYDSSLQVWKNVAASVAVPTPTLAQVTTAGNTTTNAITVGGLTVDTNTLFVDATNNKVGIGTLVPFDTLNVSGSSAPGISITSTTFTQSSAGRSSLSLLRLNTATNAFIGWDLLKDVNDTLAIRYLNSSAAAQENVRLWTNGNVTIQSGGTFTDAGFKLDVNGSVRSKFATGYNLTTTDGSLVLTSSNDGNVALGVTTDLMLRVKLNPIGINFSSNGTQLIIAGNRVYAFNNDGVLINSNVSNTTSTTNGSLIINNTVNYVNIAHIYTAQTINPTITGLAGGVARGIYINPTLTAAADFRAIETTAGKVVFNGGNVGIGTSTPATALEVAGNIKLSATGQQLQDFNGNNLIRNSAGTLTVGNAAININMALTVGTGGATVNIPNGNVLIGTTTDAGQKLQVIGSVFIKGTDSLSSTKVFEVQNGAGASIMDFRNATYAFFGCGQGGGSNSGFIFNYSNTSYTQFSGYNYGAGAGSYKPILMDTDGGGRNQGIFVNFGTVTNTPPNSDTEFGVLGRTSDSTTYISRFRNSGNTDKFAIRADGALFTNTLQGYSGTLSIPTNPPGSTNITITNGLITNIA